MIRKTLSVQVCIEVEVEVDVYSLETLGSFYDPPQDAEYEFNYDIKEVAEAVDKAISKEVREYVDDI